MDRKEIYIKYRNGIDLVSVAEDVDTNVAMDMTRSICEARMGGDNTIQYKGLPEDFPCEEYLKDYLGVEEVVKEG